jgi:hypothetical protein
MKRKEEFQISFILQRKLLPTSGLPCGLVSLITKSSKARQVRFITE